MAYTIEKCYGPFVTVHGHRGSMAYATLGIEIEDTRPSVMLIECLKQIILEVPKQYLIIVSYTLDDDELNIEFSDESRLTITQP